MSEIKQQPKPSQEGLYEAFLKGLKDSTLTEVPSKDYDVSTWIIKDEDEQATLSYLFSDLLGGKVLWFRPVMVAKYPKVFSFNVRDLFQKHDLNYTINGMKSKFVIQDSQTVDLSGKLINAICKALAKLKSGIAKDPFCTLEHYRTYNDHLNIEITTLCKEANVEPASMIGLINTWRPDYSRRFRVVVPSDTQEELNNRFLNQLATVGCGVFDFKGNNIGVLSDAVCKGNQWLLDVELITPPNEVMYPDYLYGGQSELFTNGLKSPDVYLDLINKDGNFWFELRTIEQ